MHGMSQDIFLSEVQSHTQREIIKKLRWNFNKKINLNFFLVVLVDDYLSYGVCIRKRGTKSSVVKCSK